MPGRGASWKKGGLRDGSVTEDDIDPAYQAIIEGGGGIDSEHVVDPFDNFWFYDEFFYPDPTTGLDVHYTHVQLSVNIQNLEEGGNVRFSTSTVTDDIAFIRTSSSTNKPTLNLTKNARLVWRARKFVNAVPLQSILLGAYISAEGEPSGAFPFTTLPSQYAWFRADGTGNWFAEINDGSTPQSVDTGIVDDTLYHTFEIRTNPSTPNIEFLIDDVIVATFTTDLPNATVNAIATIQTGETAGYRVIIDTLFFYQDR